MKELIYKEFKLAAHPTTFLFLGLSAMMLIPNYPYYVTFFYTTLGVFFTFLSARENHDIFYTMSLPVRKKDIVKARLGFVIIAEIMQIIVAIPFALIRRTYSLPNNAVGIEANIAFFGIVLIILGLFNFIFFNKYYKNPDKVGISFAISSICTFIFILIAEISVNVIPFMKKYIDTMDPQYIGIKLVVLLVGIVSYIFLNYYAYKRAIKSFELLDL